MNEKYCVFELNDEKLKNLKKDYSVSVLPFMPVAACWQHLLPPALTLHYTAHGCSCLLPCLLFLPLPPAHAFCPCPFTLLPFTHTACLHFIFTPHHTLHATAAAFPLPCPSSHTARLCLCSHHFCLCPTFFCLLPHRLCTHILPPAFVPACHLAIHALPTPTYLHLPTPAACLLCTFYHACLACLLPHTLPTTTHTSLPFACTTVFLPPPSCLPACLPAVVPPSPLPLPLLDWLVSWRDW